MQSKGLEKTTLLVYNRQDGNVAVGGIGNLARGGPSVIGEIQAKIKTHAKTRHKIHAH